MLERFDVIKNTLPLQVGRFGKIVLAKQKVDGKIVMLKSVFLKEFLTDDQRNKELASKEPELLRKLNSFTHANVIQLFQQFFEGEVLYLVLEYCDGGTLAKFLQARNGNQLDEHQIQSWFCQLALVVSFVHEQQIIHRGITSDNIFLDNGAKILKLGSFDIAKTIEDCLQVTLPLEDVAHDLYYPQQSSSVVGHTIIGSFRHMAPEMKSTPSYDQQVDIWQMGLVLFHMASLKEPIVTPGIDPVELNQKDFEPYSDNLKRLVSSILCDNPQDRPKIQTIVSDPFIMIPLSNYVARGALTAPGPRERTQTWDEVEEKFRPYYQKRYWQTVKMVSGKNKSIWWTAPSHIVELIPHPIQSIIVAICYNGDIVALRKTDEVVVEAWSGHVSGPKKNNPKIMHAAVDHYTSRLYFTTNRNDGIHYVNLADVEREGQLNKPVVAETFICPTKQHPNFDGIAVDVENSLIFACSEAEQVVRIFSTTNRRCLHRVSTQNDRKLAPYKCSFHRIALAEVDRAAQHSNIVLAVSDKKNSQLVLFRVTILAKTSSSSVELNLRSAFLDQLAAPGSTVGQVSNPQGLFFDPIGNLLVADDGNHRIQGFSMRKDGEHWKTPTENMPPIAALSLGTTVSSVAVFTNNDKQLCVLVGLYGATPHIGLQGVLCFKVQNDSDKST